MHDFSKKRRRSLHTALRLGGIVLGVGLLGVLTVVSTRAAWGMYQKFTVAAQERHIAEGELRELEEKEVRIGTAVASLSSERGIEAELRSRFGVAKPGEGEIKIVRDQSSAAQAAQDEGGFWSWIVETFFVW